MSIAAKGRVPEEFVGRAYEELTNEELWKIKQWRCGTNACEGCGHHGHYVLQCRRLARLHKLRQEKQMCEECASPDHDWEHCPRRKALIKSLGRLAKSGEVRPRMEGLSIPTPVIMFSMTQQQV